MKVIQFYKSEKQLIQKAAKQHRDAQRRLYEKHSPKMLSVCRRYIKDSQHAEEVMLSGFLKMFTHLNNFKFDGSFEGWLRKIMIREAINFLKKQKPLFLTDDITPYANHSWNTIDTEMEVEQIQEIIDSLPNGYRMVFVLYAVEGYKHQEIATMLSISESTSKSQLFKARKMLQQKLNAQNTINNVTIKV